MPAAYAPGPRHALHLNCTDAREPTHPRPGRQPASQLWQPLAASVPPLPGPLGLSSHLRPVTWCDGDALPWEGPSVPTPQAAGPSNGSCAEPSLLPLQAGAAFCKGIQPQAELMVFQRQEAGQGSEVGGNGRFIAPPALGHLLCPRRHPTLLEIRPLSIPACLWAAQCRPSSQEQLALGFLQAHPQRPAGSGLRQRMADISRLNSPNTEPTQGLHGAVSGMKNSSAAAGTHLHRPLGPQRLPGNGAGL
ncbi:hypothetical protein TREES_T100014272 [Tupaia chinensis]|uniref:Uncharacterized protein n=1 Tax=Tupaia chinensis TaxID=246437 RepID=L9JF17_TUPCH|nr:hypothetical protein TREES_T100014272 [Tupaia chinensis]